MEIPDSPAGRVLAAWLNAFNSADRDLIAAYHDTHEPDASAAQTLSFRGETGGFELTEIAPGDRLHVAFRVRERNRDKSAVGHLEVTEDERVVTFELYESDAPLTRQIDAATRARVIEKLAAAIDESYVHPGLASSLRERHERGDYEALDDAHVFAGRLTAHLRALARDRQLQVRCPSPRGNLQTQLEKESCGFEKVERLDGNLGYLKIEFFAPPPLCAPAASAAMAFVARCDALIVDLRDNTGGDPLMIAWICSYLFDQRTHLNDLYERRSDRTTQYWTTLEVPGEKLLCPLYVLTSRNTFAGGEEFSYDLQQLGRATIVGEPTAGGAHVTAGFRLPDGFVAGIPIARAINPSSGTNWQGVGVQPDVRVPADRALEEARRLGVTPPSPQRPVR